MLSRLTKLLFTGLLALGLQAQISNGNVSSGFTNICDSTLGSAAASITCSSISGAYKALYITFDARGDTAAVTLSGNVTFNSDTGTNYDYFTVNNNANTNGHNTANMAILIVDGASATSNFSGTSSLFIPNYANTTFNKTIVGISNGLLQNAAPIGYVSNVYGSWHPASPAAITSITITASAGNFITGSRLTVWGQQ